MAMNKKPAPMPRRSVRLEWCPLLGEFGDVEAGKWYAGAATGDAEAIGAVEQMKIIVTTQ